jgi:hypothetical protein
MTLLFYGSSQDEEDFTRQTAIEDLAMWLRKTYLRRPEGLLAFLPHRIRHVLQGVIMLPGAPPQFQQVRIGVSSPRQLGAFAPRDGKVAERLPWTGGRTRART